METTKVRRDKLTLSGVRRSPAALATATGGTVLDTRSLFNGERELKIQHNAEIYRLSITKLGKLILTK